MATLHGSGTQPLPGLNTSQASGTESHMERSARCHVFRGPKPKLLSDETLANSQSQLEYAPASNSVAFKYSAGSSAVSVYTSTTNTARQTTQAARVYGRNTASWLRFLDRKMKVTISKLDSYNHTLNIGINVFMCDRPSYLRKLINEIQQIKANKYAHSDLVKELHRLRDVQDFDKIQNVLNNSFDDTERKIEYLNANKDSYNLMITGIINEWKAGTVLDVQELERQITNQTIRKDQYNQDINEKIKALTAKQETCAGHLEMVLSAEVLQANNLDEQIKLLSAKRDSVGADMWRQLGLLIARKNSFAIDLQRRLEIFNQQLASYDHDIRRQSELMDSMKAPFVHDLDRQLKLFDAKLAMFHYWKKQQDLLSSEMLSYLNYVHETVKQLNDILTSYFEMTLSC